MPHIHYFNPGHETAILHGLENYTPPANVQNMQKELSLLPVWYADSSDYVFVEEIIAPRFFSLQPKEFRPFAIPVTRKDLGSKAFQEVQMEATPWGQSPQSIRLFDDIRQYNRLQMTVPVWKNEFTRLTSRQTAAECLERIHALLPDIPVPVAPRFCTKIREIERYLILQNAPFVIKTPFSSSGRGLLWIEKRKLSEKDKTWINGAITKQGTVSIECGLDKVQDFAMEFYSDGQGNVRYEGLSVFGTEERGAYSGNVLQEQEAMRVRLTRLVGVDVLQRIQDTVQQVLQEVYAPLYTGYLGVDMLIFKDRKGNYAVHPCIEINMRYTMGMVALRLFQKYIDPAAIGDFRVSFEGKAGEAYERHRFMKEAYPLKLENGKIKEGYLSLCPVTKDTHYRAYILIM